MQCVDHVTIYMPQRRYTMGAVQLKQLAFA